jgi:prevent-host-death family protein
MNIVRDIQSLSDFKQNASKLIKQVQETKEPMVLTVNGKAAVVVQDAESYQHLIDGREYTQTVAVLRKRLMDVDNGIEMRTAEEFFAEFSNKYGVSFED